MKTLQEGLNLPRIPESAAWRYGIAVAAFLISLFLRELLEPWLYSDRGFIVFVPAIVLVTFFAGLGPAIFTDFLSCIAIWYLFIPPFHSFRIGPDGVVGLGTFVLGSTVGITLVNWLRITIARLRAEQERSQADLLDMARLNDLSNRLVREDAEMGASLDGVLETAIAISRASKGNIQLREASGALIIAAQRGFEQPFLEFFKEVRAGGASTSGVAMQSARRVVIEDVMRSELLAGKPALQVMIDARVRAIISVPLMSSERNLLGMLSVHFVLPHRPDDGVLHRMDLLARQVADFLERKQAEETERMLIRELQHRSNNLLAVVQSIAHRSLAGDPAVARAKESFEARLLALARANRQLTKSKRGGANLNDIVRLEVTPFAERVTIEGPNLMLGPQQTQNFSLALHELATNAAKHGALLHSGGRIKIRWAIDDGGAERRLKFFWEESGGPPVEAPNRQGFGTSLLRATFADIRLDYAVDGLRCEFGLSLGQERQPLELTAAL